jgi:hypothetical protein
MIYMRDEYKNGSIQIRWCRSSMGITRRLLVILVLAVSAQTAVADEASDAVQVLSRLWKGPSDHGSASQFVGDSKTFRMRISGQMDDGTVYIETTEAPFRFLQIRSFPTEVLWMSCFQARTCVNVACLFGRECFSMTEVEHDPVYQDPQREATHYFKSREAGGYVNPKDADSVTQALRTLIRLNAAPPFNPQDPQ